MALSLGEEINAAIRPLHTTLNRLILSLFPLALPPHTSSPLLYAHGLSCILPIYVTLESALHTPNLSPHTSLLLQKLRIPALERTSRLKSDLSLLGLPTPADAASYPPHLRSFQHHITSLSTSKPHCLLAHAWILYLALFSGGRYLRSQLRHANRETWHIGPGPDAPLQFWCFEGGRDGEDLKTDFKARVRELEGMLTEQERREVVDEGKEVMKRMLDVVGEIEETTRKEEGEQKSERQKKRDNDVLWTTRRMPLHRFLVPLALLLKGLASWSWSVAAAGVGFRDGENVPGA